jgi:hypothetical protein
MTEVTLYEEAGFKGDTLRLTSDDFTLANDIHFDGFVPDTWNDEASSLRVSGGSATFYRDLGFEGPSVTLGAGSYDLARLQQLGIGNDWISSVDLLLAKPIEGRAARRPARLSTRPAGPLHAGALSRGCAEA